MIKLIDINNEFSQNKIDKKTYIEKMYQLKHYHLFDYSNYLPLTNIKKIEIEDNSIIMVSRSKGIRINLPEGDLRNHALEIINFGDVEKNELIMMQNLLVQGSTIFDIGANIGWHSINMALHDKTLNIHAFEPAPEAYKQLIKNLKLNSIRNVTSHNYGISNKTGELEFYINKNVSGNSSLKNLSDSSEFHAIKCNFYRLDEIPLEVLGKITFIKCDVEGAELPVFLGATKLIEKYKPIIFAEVLRKFASKFNYDPNEIFKLLDSLGYNSYSLNKDRLIPFYCMNQSTIFTNFFFLHREAHREAILRWAS